MYLNETDYMQRKRAVAAIAKLEAQLKMPGFKEQYGVLKTRKAKWAKVLKGLDAKEAKAKAEAAKASENKTKEAC